jgi:hypothetical protein
MRPDMTRKYSEIRDLLAKQKLDGLFGQGASEDQISDCESNLNVRLPPSYRQFLKEYGWGYFGSLELIAGLGVDIPEEWDRGANLLQVVNDERRGPLGMPEKVIPFCQNGAGDWYALDCSRSDNDESPVVFVSHEQAPNGACSANKCANSFADWIFAKLSVD